MPPVTKRLIAFALGENEILEFAAFTPENLKGGAISLAIGAMVYLFVVRRLLSGKVPMSTSGRRNWIWRRGFTDPL